MKAKRFPEFDVSYRVGNLTDESTQKYKAVFPPEIIRVTMRFDNSGYVVCVHLVDENVVDKLCEILKCYPDDAASCDICISLLTSVDSRIYGVPRFVNKLIVIANCEIVLNYTRLLSE